MDSIQRANQGNIRPQDISGISTESVRVELDPDGECVDAVIDNYPYTNQTEYSGSIYYQESSPIPELAPDEEEIEFRYRQESGLLILHGQIDETKSRAIVHHLNQTLAESTNDVFMSVSFGRLNLWSFIFHAENQPQLVVRDGFDNECSNEEISDLSRNELVKEFSLDRATAVFYNNGERINVSYDSGILNFTESVSENGKEYVLQLFERYVVHGDLLEEFEDIE